MSVCIASSYCHTHSSYVLLLLSVLLIASKSACGLIPIASPVRSVNTQGLRWNLSYRRENRCPSDVWPYDGEPTSFTGTLSTSNLLDVEELGDYPEQHDSSVGELLQRNRRKPHYVHIKTSDVLLWCCEFHKE